MTYLIRLISAHAAATPGYMTEILVYFNKLQFFHISMLKITNEVRRLLPIEILRYQTVMETIKVTSVG
jgi:hypothetical protein